MNTMADLPITVRVGGTLETQSIRCLRPFDSCTLAFLAELSELLLHDAEGRRFADVAAFAFWCRRAHLSGLAALYNDGVRRLGRGLILHVAPANVPVTFAFSFAFGLLAGNANVVRLPQADYGQIRVICNAIGRLFAQPEHQQVACMNRLIQYPHDDAVTRALSLRAAGRVIWGGDDTVTRIRSLPSHPRCVDIAFADRYSLCLLKASAVIDAEDDAMRALATAFFNDSFTLHQNACSSPHLLLWLGSENQALRAQTRFWEALHRVVAQRFVLSNAEAVDKYAVLCGLAVRLPDDTHCQAHGNGIYRLSLPTLPPDIERLRGRYGIFFEHYCTDLDALNGICSHQLQTITCFGIPTEDVADHAIAHGFSGVDRVVRVGQALNLGLVWDGYDLITSLSRVVSTG